MLTATTTPTEGGGLHAVARIALAGLLAGAAFAAQAQRADLRPAVQVKSITTSNVSFTTADLAKADSLLIVTPRLDAVLTHPDYRLSANLAADLVTYVGRSRADRVLPQARVDLNAKLVDRWLYLDTNLAAGSTSFNPFGVLEVDSATVFNRAKFYQERISPYLDHLLAPGERVQLRTDHSWTQNTGGTATVGAIRSYLESQVARYDLRPTPLGLSADAVRSTSTYGATANSDVTFETVRVSPTYAVNPTLDVFASVGRDVGQYASTRRSEALVGGGLRWAPSPRDLLDGRIEQRFFGTGWAINATHRSPFMVVNANLVRQATTYSARIAALPAGGDVAQLLDALLTTRIPNPADRATAVQQMIAQQGLPTTLAAATDLFSPTAQLQQAASVSMALMGARHTVTLRLFYDRAEDLLGNDPPPLLSGNLRQYGLSLSANRRLQSDLTADLGYTQLHVAGFGPNLGQLTTNRSYRLGATQQLSLRTSVSATLRRLLVDSSSVANANQSALTLGLLHRF
jgi:uncharacterized protein (PEP-CTERM system associated)